MRSHLLSTFVMLSVMSTGACRTAGDKSNNDARSPTAASEESSSPDKADVKIERRVKRLIADEFGIEEDEVGLDANLVDDLDADDLDRVELVMRLEEEFDIEVPDEYFDKLKTVRDMCDYVKNHKK